MQLDNWNNLRCLLAIKRGRTIAAGARILGVDNTTLSRRLASLQSGSGDSLFSRQADGTLTLTSVGDAIAQRVEVMEHQVDKIGNLVGSTHDSCVGSVRLTSVPIISNRLLAPATEVLLSKHPLLQVELIPDSRDLSLTRREADLAIRLSRPTTGGSNVKARRIASLEYTIFAAASLSAKEISNLRWITYDHSLAHLPQAKWISEITKGASEEIYGLRIHDADTALEAAVSGCGKALLPTFIARRDKRLQQLEPNSSSPPPIREMWLLSNADQREFSTVDTVVSWIENTVKHAMDEKALES